MSTHSPTPPAGGFAQWFPFKLGDRITVNEVHRPGRIEAITIDFLGTQYRVSYWDNSERKVVYLFADDIKLQ